MKTETQVAKENVETFKNPFPDGIEGNPWTEKIRCGVKGDIRETIESHKQTCQRDVPKLKELNHLLDCCTSKKAYQDYLDKARELVDKDLEDKEQAIKIYDEAGI